jgi:cytochrome P450
MDKTTQIPKIPTIVALSDIQEMIKSPIAVFEKYRKQKGPTFKFRFGLGTTIVTTDPEMIKHVLKDKNDIYHKSQIQTKYLVEFQGVGLNNSHGDYWLEQRKHLSMGFTPGRLTETLPIQIKVLDEFMTEFDKVIENGPVDMHKQMENFTIRSVGTALFGSQMKVEDYERFAVAIEEVQQYILKKIVKPYLKPWFILSGQNKKYHKIRDEGDQLLMEYLQERRKTLGEGNDILEMIMTTPFKGSDEIMSDEKIRIEILQLMVAGNETSSTASTWVFYILAKYPECIPKIREEVDSVFGDSPVDYQKLHKLTYTLSVLEEAMRLYPPFWMIDREAQEDDEYNGVKIAKGTTVVTYIYGAHQNEEYWEDPEKFDPSRFDSTTENHAFAHIPFGGGPRVCIGQNMAKTQILLVMSTIVRKYHFSLADDTKVEMKAMMLIKPDGPVMMNFTKVQV